MSKNRLLTLLAALVVFAAVTTLLASNMGFKIVYTLKAAAPGISASGTNTLSLPYIPKGGITNAEQLFDDIGTGIVNIQRYNRANDQLAIYSKAGTDPPPFPIVAGESYYVKVIEDVDYRILGSHDPGLVITLLGPEDPNSASGVNPFAPPYHTTVTNAEELMNDIGPAVLNIQRYNRANDQLAIYSKAGTDPPPFPIVMGEGYFVKVSHTVQYVPSHY